MLVCILKYNKIKLISISMIFIMHISYYTINILRYLQYSVDCFLLIRFIATYKLTSFYQNNSMHDLD